MIKLNHAALPQGEIVPNSCMISLIKCSIKYNLLENVLLFFLSKLLLYEVEFYTHKINLEFAE